MKKKTQILIKNKETDTNKERAFQMIMAIRDQIKNPVSINEIVEDLRKDRQSH